MKKRGKWLAAGLVLLVGIGFFVMMARRDPAPPETLTVQEESFVQVISATGRLVPARTVQLQSQISGRLLEVPYDEGDPVTTGNVLVTLDDREARQRLAESQASLTLARSRARSLAEVALPATEEELIQLKLNQEQLERTLTRQESLYESGALPLESLEETLDALDRIRSQVRSAELTLTARQAGGAEAAETAASVAQARSRVETLELELNHYQLAAPFNGRVLERLVEPGEVVQPGTVLLVLAGDEGFFAEVDLDERSMGLIQPGQTARVWPEAFPSREVKATVESLAPRVNPDTGTVGVRLALEESADFLIRDLTIQVEINVRSLDQALLIPVEYLWQTDPATVLRVAGGVVEAVTLPRVENVSLNQLLVLEGLEKGNVLLNPEEGFRPGDSITLPPPTEGGDGS